METQDTLKNVQQVELEILEVIHKVCVENHLRYSLAYGTLIGAIRHKGFIPWDDDIDICMPREDYEKFLKIWPNYQFENYILQNIRTDEDFTQSFTKIRKNHTTFLQPNEEQYKYHKGFFVDIFPGDRLPDSRFKRYLQFFNIAVYLLYCRKFKSGSSNKMISIMENIFLALPKSLQRKLRNKSEKYLRKFNGNEDLQYVFASTINDAREYYPKDIFEDLILVEFEGKKFYSFKEFDRCLRIQYGDYMKLPPENERVWAHTPQLIDYHRNYEEIVK